jgi:hypothetical protein
MCGTVQAKHSQKMRAKIPHAPGLPTSRMQEQGTRAGGKSGSVDPVTSHSPGATKEASLWYEWCATAI